VVEEDQKTNSSSDKSESIDETEKTTAAKELSDYNQMYESFNTITF
jgi:hypothetical protein